MVQFSRHHLPNLEDLSNSQDPNLTAYLQQKISKNHHHQDRSPVKLFKVDSSDIEENTEREKKKVSASVSSEGEYSGNKSTHPGAWQCTCGQQFKLLPNGTIETEASSGTNAVAKGYSANKKSEKGYSSHTPNY